LKPRHDSRNTQPAGNGSGLNPLQWLASKLAELRAPRPLAPLRIPRRPELRAPRRGALAALWEARRAARAGIPPDEYLQHRLSRQLASLPIPPSRLPVAITIEPDGTVAAAPVAVAPPRRAPWLESFLRAEGSSALGPEIQLAQADVARLAIRIESQRKQVDEVARALEDATQGTEVADPADEAQAQQMGRPPVPPPGGLALHLFALALLLAETWQLGVPGLEAAGIRTADLPGELHRNPLAVVFGCIFALGASASLFLFAYLGLRRALDLFEAQPEPKRRAWAAAGAALALALAVAMAWSVAGMRPGAHQPVDVGYARAALFLVALAIPLAVAWLLTVASRLDAERGAALALAREWDKDHYRSLAELSRRAGGLAEEERRLARLEADRAAAGRRLRALQQRRMAAERLAADAADAEEAELARLAQAVVSGLELDRYEYARHAGLRATRSARPIEPRATAAPTPTPAPAHDVERNLGLAG
jgi:hypothetical protein